MRHLMWVALAVAAAAGCAGSESDEDLAIVDAQCGEVTCGKEQYCCDAQCGLCVEMEVACNMTCP